MRLNGLYQRSRSQVKVKCPKIGQNLKKNGSYLECYFPYRLHAWYQDTELAKSLTTHELLFRLKQKFYRIMYKLFCQHLQSLNSIQQKLFVLQPLKDMFQNRSPAEPQVQPRVVTALTRPEPHKISLCGVTSRTGCMGTTPDHP